MKDAPANRPTNKRAKYELLGKNKTKKDEDKQQAEMLKFLSNNNLWGSLTCNDMWKRKPDSH